MLKSVFQKILIFRVSQKKGSKNSNIEKRSKKGPKITMFCRLSQLYQNEPSSFFIKAILNVRDRAIKNQKRLWVLLEPFLNIRLFRTLFWDYIFKKKNSFGSILRNKALILPFKWRIWPSRMWKYVLDNLGGFLSLWRKYIY